MDTTFENLLNVLNSKNIRLSHQRLKILEYIISKRSHPTADEIYTELHKDIPTLSKTTVYNTLSVLSEAGIVKAIKIENNENKYDIAGNDHGHFKCESCGNIYDFKLDINSLNSNDLGNFRINSKDVYFTGVCPECIKQEE